MGVTLRITSDERVSDENRSGQESAHYPVIVGVSRDLRGLQGFIEGHTAKGVRLQVPNSHTGNHREDDFTPLETIRRFLGVIGSRSFPAWRGGLRAESKGMSSSLSVECDVYIYGCIEFDSKL
ncbi:hypothetical protein Tco_1416416 [Tanacetum coccineum]